MKIFNDGFNTHMPYIDGDNRLYFCRASLEERELQKDIDIHYGGDSITKYKNYDIYSSTLDGDDITPILGGLGEKSISCTPTVCGDTLYYVAANTSLNVKYKYYCKIRTDGVWGPRQIAPNPVGVRNLYCASDNPLYHFICYPRTGDARIFIYNKQSYMTSTLYIPNITTLIRAVPIANDNNKIIITYDKEGTYCSSLINLYNKSIQRIKVQGQNVYKCSILGSTIVYSVKNETETHLEIDEYSLGQDTTQVR